MTIRPAVIFVTMAAALSAAPAQAEGLTGNVATGSKLFLQCRACHAIGPAEPHGIGPNLSGVFGAKAAAKLGYRYSPALTASKLTWSRETLDAWLKKPSGLVPGTKMAFTGVASAQSRADVIAYLTSLNVMKR